MSDLDNRYGRNRSTHLPQWLVWVVVGIMTLGVLYFWFSTMLSPGASIETQTGRFNVISDAEVEVTARVSAQPGTALACVAEAENRVSTTVGYKVVELEPVDHQHQTVTVVLQTTQAADTAIIEECWVR
ncbi:DUF4307 domain-containing protein [Gulosibacter bifidus]|uniref:DUF4307 domain-containing protein n=1 Tax=Gulosibacter bifidus TaxID=272239 RepID=A0ABW5RHI2_9MICO|nr:DUF4307 domain-containing protein [Gulosibacter bifidus]